MVPLMKNRIYAVAAAATLIVLSGSIFLSLVRALVE